MSLIAVSLASEPDDWNSTFDIFTGAISMSFSARSMLCGCDRPLKVW